MPESIISEGKTTNEAIENGLKELKVSKDRVDIKVLENPDKRSFFSILSPRIVKVELTLKENIPEEKFHKESKNDRNYNKEKNIAFKETEVSPKEIEEGQSNLITFLNDFSKKAGNLSYTINVDQSFINVHITGEEATKLIGYRGETLNALQTILSSIANKNINNKIKVILNIQDYRQKREKALEELAEKVSKTVLRTGKSITLEPMMAYERKIIHSKLQLKEDIKTYSTGEEPYRRVVISKR